jgi:AraC family L-rhamnose operon regulatory protein RhaS
MQIPIYQDHGKMYEADACRPVERAAAAGRIEHHALVRGHYPGRPLPPKTLLGVKVVGYWDARARQDWGLDWHRNEGLELTFLENGRLGFAVEGHVCALQAGDLTVTRPWQQHRVGDPEVAAGRLHFLILDVAVRRPHQAWRWPPWLVLTPDDLQQLTHILRHNEQPVWRASAEVSRSFVQIAAAVKSQSVGAGDGRGLSRLTVSINQLFLALLEMFHRQDIRLDESLSTARRTVELFWSDLTQDHDHLIDEWTVRSMAKRCGMGVTNFIHCTKQLVNMTPMHYLSHCRLSMAAHLLHELPERSITDIAFGCGFASSQYFATLFRARFGSTPRQFRDAR